MSTPLPPGLRATVTTPTVEQARPSNPANDREIEWQFDAVDLRPVERWLDARITRPPGEGNGAIDAASPGIRVTPEATRRLADTYFDTEDWRFFRSGFTLRVRAASGKAEATLKSMAPATQGRRSRTEITEALPPTSANIETLLQSEGPVGSRIRLIAGTHGMVPLFEVKTTRRSYSLGEHGQVVGEIAVDRTTIPMADGAEPVRLSRVEVEVRDPDRPAVSSFVDELRAGGGLREAAVSKFEAGLIALGEPTPPSADLEPTEIDDSSTVGEVAFSVLRAQFGVFLAKEGGTRLGEDPEELHDMRVATRRLRAAIAVFAEALPARGASLRSELKWVGRSLGAVRDVDVQMEWIREEAPGEEAPSEKAASEDAPGEQEAKGEGEAVGRDSVADLEALLARRREEARAQLLAALDSRRYERLVASMLAMLERGPLSRGPGRTSVLAAAPDLIERLYRRFRKAGKRIDKDSEPAEYHRVRIRGKRLRYASEFLSPVYGRPAKRLAERLVSVQDLLGLHQDTQVAMTWLRELAVDRSSALAPSTVFVMGRIAERHAQAAAAARAKFTKLYGKVKGKSWRKFAKLMEQRRPPASESSALGAATSARSNPPSVPPNPTSLEPPADPTTD